MYSTFTYDSHRSIHNSHSYIQLWAWLIIKFNYYFQFQHYSWTAKVKKKKHLRSDLLAIREKICRSLSDEVYTWTVWRANLILAWHNWIHQSIWRELCFGGQLLTIKNNSWDRTHRDKNNNQTDPHALSIHAMRFNMIPLHSVTSALGLWCNYVISLWAWLHSKDSKSNCHSIYICAATHACTRWSST